MYLRYIVLVLSINVTLSFGDSVYPFQNISLSWDERVDDLISRLTIDEIVDQLSHGGYSDAGPTPPIPRLGINSYSWNTECLRGDVFKIFLLKLQNIVFFNSILLQDLYPCKFYNICTSDWFSCYLEVMFFIVYFLPPSFFF